ncbi:PadR family transcriptional regulator [Microbacterium sp. VKM Ac-2870]|uniref:PadR family transcriptional regulator n=1 Tax=Microbacterium sp. VKM Ac-2870 TaxID=2783825 RepID=UPI00188A08D7|nr:PadR family transcriptional regulator [Microbacterium sp. VKM Ac-2870]MBF4562442.1 PadR family transcriptional regulator [Microbacterium sp. VKM Ac-2870]
MKTAIDRLTPLGVMVLALLREDDMHPYEMIRLMRHRHDDRILSVTNGTMYHTVARLEKSGLVADIGVDRDGNRPERTTYRLTDAGHAAVVDWVRRELPRLDRPTEFRVALAEAHNLARDETIALLSTRLAALARTRDDLADGIRHARESAAPPSVIEQYLIEVDRDRALLAADHDWLAALLERLAHPDFVWGSHEKTDRYLAQREAARS